MLVLEGLEGRATAEQDGPSERELSNAIEVCCTVPTSDSRANSRQLSIIGTV